VWWGPHRSIAIPFATEKLWLCDGEKTFDDMLRRFDRILACDGQKDGQTSFDGIVCTALCIASRGKT